MSTERRSTASDHDEPATRISAESPDTAHDATADHDDNVIRLGFRERPYFDEMLQKRHPSLRYFDTYRLYPTFEGYVPILVSSVLVDTAIRH